MILIRQHRIYRQDLQENRHILYIFGDNLDRKGLGGQAKEMRGELNAFGIATKRSITHNYPEDYFFDTDPGLTPLINNEFNRLEKFLKLFSNEYKAIVIPLDGIGTGLARLSENAPKALKYINHRLELLRTL